MGAGRYWMEQHGVGKDDRVVALLPNRAHAHIAMLATASLAATWASCSPDFGPTAIADRFTQIEPKLLFAVDGYHYGGKQYDIEATVEELRKQLPTLRETVLVPYLDPTARLRAATP